MHGHVEDEGPEDGEAPGVGDGVEVLGFRVDGGDGPVEGWEGRGGVVAGCGAAGVEVEMEVRGVAGVAGGAGGVSGWVGLMGFVGMGDGGGGCGGCLPHCATLLWLVLGGSVSWVMVWEMISRGEW